MITFICLSSVNSDLSPYECLSCGDLFFYSDLERHALEDHGSQEVNVDYSHMDD